MPRGECSTYAACPSLHSKRNHPIDLTNPHQVKAPGAIAPGAFDDLDGYDSVLQARQLSGRSRGTELTVRKTAGRVWITVRSIPVLRGPLRTRLRTILRRPLGSYTLDQGLNPERGIAMQRSMARHRDRSPQLLLPEAR